MVDVRAQMIKGDLLQSGYIDVDDILTQITDFLNDCPVFQFKVEFCPLENVFAELACLYGKTGGTEMKLWLQKDFPKSAPIVVVCPPNNYEIVGDHPIVRPIRLSEINIGRVELPLLSNWIQGTKLSSIIDSVQAALSLIPWSQAITKPQKEMTGISALLKSLPREYGFPEDVIKQSEELMSQHPHLYPRKEIHIDMATGDRMELIQFRGTISVWYKGREYPTPIMIWIPFGFPTDAPEVRVDPTPEMSIDTAHPNLDNMGVVKVPCLSKWVAGTQSLTDVIEICRGVFSTQPPMYRNEAKESKVFEFMTLVDCDHGTAKRLLDLYSFEDAQMHYVMEQTSCGSIGGSNSGNDRKMLYEEFPHIDREIIDLMYNDTQNVAMVRQALGGGSGSVTPGGHDPKAELNQLKRLYPTLTQLIDDLYKDSGSIEVVKRCIAENATQEKNKDMAIMELSKEFPDFEVSLIKEFMGDGKSKKEVQVILQKKMDEMEALCEEFSDLHPGVIKNFYMKADDIAQARRRLKRQDNDNRRKQMLKEYPDIQEHVLDALFPIDADTPPAAMVKQRSMPQGIAREELLDMYSSRGRLFGFGDTVFVSEDAWNWKKAVVVKIKPEIVVTVKDSVVEKSFPYIKSDMTPQELAHLLFKKYDDQRLVRIIMSYIRDDDIFMKKKKSVKKKKSKKHLWGQVRHIKSTDKWEAKLDDEVVDRLFECKRDAQRFLLTRKLADTLDNLRPSYIGGTLLDRKVMSAYSFENEMKFSLLLCAAHHAEIPYSAFRASMDTFLERIGELGSDQIVITLPVDDKISDEDLELGALVSMGWVVHLFVAGCFVKTFTPSIPSDVKLEPLYLNRNTEPAEYQLFEWQKDKLSSADKQTCQMLVDDCMQAGGATPSVELLQKYFDNWQIGPAMDLCSKKYEEAINLIAAQALQAEEEMKMAMEFECLGCRRFRPREIELYMRTCGCTRCYDCVETWMEDQLEEIQQEKYNRKEPQFTCKSCRIPMDERDIRQVSSKLWSALSHEQITYLAKKQGAIECFHPDCNILFFPSDTHICNEGHENCLKCRTCHASDEDCAISEWGAHAPGDVCIIRRFLWPDTTRCPPEFDYLKRKQNCTSNSVVGPKAFRQIGGSFGLINSVKDSDIVGGGISNLNSGGQVAKNGMGVRGVLQRCQNKIRYVHGRYRGDAPHRARICLSNEDIVQKIYDDWGGSSHNEILLNLDHTMVCGLWSDEQHTKDLKLLQEMFADMYERQLKLYVITSAGKMQELEEFEKEGGGAIQGFWDIDWLG